MELRHLRYFQAVAELLNFSRAAERLHVAQPALSRQVQNLEAELGARLFDRNHVRVSLTDAGRTFYAHACKVLAQVDDAVASVHDTTNGISGELVICNDWRLANPAELGAIAEFRARHPHVTVTLRDLHIHEQLTALRTRQAHVGFIVWRELATDGELESLHLLTSDLMVAIGAGHRLAEARNVRLADLAGDKWVITSAREWPGLREFITQVCRLSGFTPSFAADAHNTEGVLARIATGEGLCLVPEFLVKTFPANPLVRYLRCDSPPIELRAVWHKREQSRLLRQYLEILRRHAGRGLKPATRLQANPADSASS